MTQRAEGECLRENKQEGYKGHIHHHGTPAHTYMVDVMRHLGRGPAWRLIATATVRNRERTNNNFVCLVYSRSVVKGKPSCLFIPSSDNACYDRGAPCFLCGWPLHELHTPSKKQIFWRNAKQNLYPTNNPHDLLL